MTLNKIKRVGIIIEARSNSKRLPNKHFLKTGNKTIIEHLITRVKKINNINNIIIATTKNREDDKLCNLAKKNKINYFRGSETNVTKRVLDCANKFKLDYICEITGDCPIIDIELVQQLILTFLKNINLIDYATNEIGLPNGMGCQVFKKSILKKSYKDIKNNLEEQEHVTLNIRRNPKKYRLFFLKHPEKYNRPDIEVTLDEIYDYYLLSKIIKYFNNKKKLLFNCIDVINLLKNKKQWLKYNKFVKRRNNIL